MSTTRKLMTVALIAIALGLLVSRRYPASAKP